MSLMDSEEESSDYKLSDYGSNFSSVLEKKWKIKMKTIIISILGVILLIISLIIILVIIYKKEEDEESDIDDEDYSKLVKKGQITCTYNIDDNTVKTKILGEEHEKPTTFQMIIDGKNIKYSKEYKFSTIGTHYITFNLFEDLSLDYMFKDVETLTEIKLESDKNCAKMSKIYHICSLIQI